jgi:putative ABC transport system permease protein
VSGLWRDLRFSIRLYARTPAVTIAAFVTLALGVGANTAIFSFADALLLRPLPIREPDRVLALFHVARGNPARFSSFAHPDYEALRDGAAASLVLAARSSVEVDVGDGDALERLPGEIVSYNYFDVLGVLPALGRSFTAAEDRTPGTHAVAIVSHALWMRRFGGAPDVVGRTLPVNGRPFVIVGVAPTSLREFDVYQTADVWVPLMMYGTVLPWMNAAGRSLFDNRTTHWLDIVGRLREGATIGAAQGACTSIGDRLTREIAGVNPAWEWDVRAVPLDQARLGPPVARPLVRFTWLLAAVVGLVLLIACANVANLLLVRSLARRREIGIRFAVGANRRLVVRQLLTESLLLSVAAGAAGLLAAGWALHLIGALDLGSFLPGLALRIDCCVVAFALALTVGTGVAFGLLPALQGSNVDVAGALKVAAAAVGVPPRAGSLRQALVAGQVAICAVLLTGTGLALRTLMNLYAVPLGFDIDHVAVASLDLSPGRFAPADGADVQRRIVERVAARPGVDGVSLAFITPFSGFRMANDVFWERGTAGARGRTNVDMNVVGSDYFRTMSIPVVRGRAFTPEDRAGAPGVAVANEALAAQLWPGQDPIGRRLWLWNPRGQDRPLEIVGVAADGRYSRAWRSAPRPFLFLPSGQQYYPNLSLLVRARTPAALTAADIRREARTIAPAALVVRVEPLTAALAHAIALERLSAKLLTLFGLVALALAAIGVYGVVSISAAARTREMGIRVALGATPGAIARQIVWTGLAPVVIGAALGLAAALGLSRLVAGLLFGVTPTDPPTMAGVALVLVAAASAASALPARRATRVDPVAALRAE